MADTYHKVTNDTSSSGQVSESNTSSAPLSGPAFSTGSEVDTTVSRRQVTRPTSSSAQYSESNSSTEQYSAPQPHLEGLHRSSLAFYSSANDPHAAEAGLSGSYSMMQREGGRTFIAANNLHSQHPAKDLDAPMNPATESNPLASHHRPSVRGADHQGIEGNTTVNMAATSQNAPGKAGSVGESAMGALGYGGSTVGRPKEDQGIGEKIANFLGA